MLKKTWMQMPILLASGFWLHIDCWGQAPKPAEPPQGCPEKVYEKACKSYWELLNAGDDGVKVSSTRHDVALVCFREIQDAFFVVSLERPRSVADVTSSSSLGLISEYINGVGDNRTLPIQLITGNWEMRAGELIFVAKHIDTSEADKNTGVLSLASQFIAFKRYENTKGEKIDYLLTIQRSTGRFSESYTRVVDKTTFSESTGRCINPTAK